MLTFWGLHWLGCLGCQVGLLVQHQEGCHPQLAVVQELDALLRHLGVLHHDVVQLGAGCADSHIVSGIDGPQVACAAQLSGWLRQC